jgi:multidrug efflux pump subunit AcrA (membrane-fusion protein)
MSKYIARSRLLRALPPGPSALRMTRSTRSTRRLAQVLLLIGFTFIVSIIIAPWQQSVSGQGRVIAFAPLDRQQLVQAPIAGRVAEFHVIEGQHVEEGDLIATISDNDPQLLSRLEREREAVAARLRTAETSIEITEQRIAAMESSRLWQLTAADSRVAMARDRLEAAERNLEGAEAEVLAAELNLERQKDLIKDGLVSTRSVELAELGYTKAKADKARAVATIAAAKREVKALNADANRIESDADASVDKARTDLEYAKADRTKHEQDLAKAEVGVSRQETMVVRAPRAGTVLRQLVAQNAEMLSAGDPIVTFVPDTAEPAVEVWVDGNDVPLVQPGRHVRLQFEGWPAVQFVGWPSVAVGTFPGEVAFVDRTDDGKGRFRVVVVPEEGGTPWPSSTYLRQGVRANAWVLLDRVTLGWELWRQFNGFPPALRESPDDKDDGSMPAGGSGGDKDKGDSLAKRRKPKL